MDERLPEHGCGRLTTVFSATISTSPTQSLPPFLTTMLLVQLLRPPRTTQRPFSKSKQKPTGKPCRAYAEAYIPLRPPRRLGSHLRSPRRNHPSLRLRRRSHLGLSAGPQKHVLPPTDWPPGEQRARGTCAARSLGRCGGARGRGWDRQAGFRWPHGTGGICPSQSSEQTPRRSCRQSHR